MMIMKYIKTKNIARILFMLLVVIVCSCDNNFDDINTNPNQATSDNIPVNNLFLRLLRNTTNETLNETFLLLGEHRGFAFPNGIAAYQEGTASRWDGFYEEIKNANQLIKLTAPEAELASANNNAVAKILKVILFQRLVDMFGAVPYFEGGNGLEFPQPTYDSEEVIYNDLVKELDQAIATLNSNTEAVFSADVDYVYGGVPSKWAVFANSLKLRIGMRMRFVSPEKAKTIITQSLAMPLMSVASDSWEFTYPGTETNNQSPLYVETSPNVFLSEFLLTQLRNTNDPRTFAFAEPAGVDKNIYQGQVNGLNINFDDGAQSTRSSVIYQDKTFGVHLMALTEVQFLKAEAALANIGGGNANELFRNGIKVNMERWNVPTEDMTTFLASPEATLVGTEEEMLKQIIIQKWIGLYYNGHEAYAEMRRTGYPFIEQRSPSGEIDRVTPLGDVQTISVGYRLGITNGVFPSRVEYPKSEKELNPENYNAAVSTYGNGLLDTVWWDVR